MDDARYSEILEFVSQTGLAIRSGDPDAEAKISHALGLLGEVWHDLDPNAARATIRTARAEWWVYDEALKRAFASVEEARAREEEARASREAERQSPGPRWRRKR